MKFYDIFFFVETVFIFCAKMCVGLRNFGEDIILRFIAVDFFECVFVIRWCFFCIFKCFKPK